MEPEFYVEFDFPGSKSLMITEQVKNNVTFFYNKKAETWLNENNVNFLYYFFLKFWQFVVISELSIENQFHLNKGDFFDLLLKTGTLVKSKSNFAISYLFFVCL